MIFDHAPENWEVVQQNNNGYADVSFEGHWEFQGNDGPRQVYIRVVDENTRVPVIDYTACQMQSDRKWSVTLSIPKGGRYLIDTVLQTTDEPPSVSVRGDMVRHLGVGDVWVIAGQSNASGFGREPIKDLPDIGVSARYGNGAWDIATHPLADSTGTLTELSRERINGGVSPWIAFAKAMKKVLGYPIGLIPTSKGSSQLARWNPNEDGDLYRNMLSIIDGRAVRGVLWYQGESDTYSGRFTDYAERFEAFVERLRLDVRSPDGILPIFTVQLNQRSNMTEERLRNWAKVRSDQALCSQKLPYVYMVRSKGLKLTDAIHNASSSNLIIGRRVASAALNEFFGADR